MRLSPAMKAAVSARLAEAGTVAQRQALAGRIGDPQDPARAAGDLGDGLVAEAMQDLVERRLHRRQRRELLDQRIAGGHGFLAQDRVALGVGHGPRHEIALVVGERFLQLHREGVGQIFEARLPRRQVDGDVVPFRDGDVGDASVQQGLAGGDQLDDAGMAGLKIGLHGPDQRGAFHGGQEMAEETLLRALEGRQRGGLRVLVEGGIALHDAGGFERVFYIAVDHLEGAGIGVVDAPLLGCQGMFEQLNLDPVIAERTGLVEAEGLQIAGDHLHRRHPAGLHGGDEIGALLEGRLAARIRAAPEPKAPRIGQAGHRGGPGGGDIEDTRIGQGVLQTQSGASLLRGGRIASRSLGSGSVGHGVGLVEHYDAAKGMAGVFVHSLSREPASRRSVRGGSAFPGGRASARLHRWRTGYRPLVECRPPGGTCPTG